MNTPSTESPSRTFVRAASLADLPAGGRLTVTLDGHVIALFHTPEGVFALDNRCPHMGFPLDRGTVKDCILTCHWHHARFDLHSGGAFDPWADDVRAFPVKLEGGEVLIDLAPRGDSHRHRVERLRDGIERNISLVIGKSVIAMLDDERRRARRVSHRTRIRHALSARRLGRRSDHPHLHDESAAASARRRSPACDVPRVVLGRQRFRRPSTAL